MPTLFYEDTLEAPAAAVWAELRDIRSPARLTTIVNDVEVLSDTERICSTDQGPIAETIISVDDERQRVAYTATETSWFPITHHNAAFVVTGDNTSATVSWTIDIEPVWLADAMRPVLETQFQVAVSRLAGVAEMA